jgi:hypothetical protein
MGIIKEARGENGSEGGGGTGSRFVSREPSVERDADVGGWASYAFPTQSQFQSTGRGPTPLSQAPSQTLNVDGMSEAALDGATPIATRFSFTRNGSGGTAGGGERDGEKEETASESGTTIVAAGEGGVENGR